MMNKSWASKTSASVMEIETRKSHHRREHELCKFCDCSRRASHISCLFIVLTLPPLGILPCQQCPGIWTELFSTLKARYDYMTWIATDHIRWVTWRIVISVRECPIFHVFSFIWLCLRSDSSSGPGSELSFADSESKIPWSELEDVEGESFDGSWVKVACNRWSACFFDSSGFFDT